MCLQTIVDLKSIGEDEGLRTRIVEFVIRDDRGFFYLFTNKSIQQFDGERFEDVSSQIILDQKELLKDLISVEKNGKNSFVLNFRDSKNQYVLNTEKNKIKLRTSKKSQYFKDGINYLLEAQGSGYSIQSNQNSVNISLATFPSELLITGNFIICQGERNIVSIFENNKLVTKSYEGRIIKVDERIYLWSGEGIYKFQKGTFDLIHKFEKEGEVCGVLKKDKAGNIIAAYSERTNYYYNLYLLDKQEKVHVFNEVVNTYPIIRDIYSEDFFNKMMVVGYNGVKVFSFLKEGIRIFFRQPNVSEGDFGKIIMGVANDIEGNLMVQSESGEVHLYNQETEEFDELFTKKNKIVSEGLSSLKYDQISDCFYIRGYSYSEHSDLYRYSLPKKKWIQRRLNYKIHDFIFLPNGKMLLGGYNWYTKAGFIAEYDFDNNKLVIKRDDLKQVESVYLDNRRNKIWVATHGGIEVLDLDYKKLATIDKYQGKDHYILYDFISMFLPYNEHLIACSRGGGVYILDPNSYKVLNEINVQSGLTEDMAVSAIEDDAGRLWIGTFNGLNVLDKDYKILKKIYAFEGLPNKEFNTRAVGKNRNGSLVFGTLNGLSILSPEKVMDWRNSYMLNIDQIDLYQKGKVIDGKNDAILEFYDTADSLKLTYTIADYIKYPFVATAVELDAKFKDGFKTSSYHGAKTLTNFKTGENEIYLNTDRGRQDKKIIINVKPDRSTLYTFLCFTILGLGLIYLITKGIIDRNKAKEQEKTLINKKISELQLASLQAQMNPHFIFNALGAIQYFIQTHDADKADEYLSDFAKLMRKILESSMKKYVSIREEIQMLNLYIGLEKIRFESMFDYELIIDDDIDEEMKIPPMIIQPIIENAINHGLYHLTERTGKLKIHLKEEEEDFIVVTITDNGIGRKRARALRNKIHHSRGMQIVEERIETINRTGDLRVEMLTKDLVTDNMAAGTEVKISIKEI